MMYEQLLHDFVDGSLDYQGEVALFSELQANEALRGELKVLMMMRKAIPHDVRAYSPSAESHEAIFRTLGFSSPAETREGSALGAGLLTLRRYLQGIVGGLIGAALMAMVLLLIGNGPAVTGRTEPATAPSPAAGSVPSRRAQAPPGLGARGSARAPFTDNATIDAAGASSPRISDPHAANGMLAENGMATGASLPRGDGPAVERRSIARRPMVRQSIARPKNSGDATRADQGIAKRHGPDPVPTIMMIDREAERSADVAPVLLRVPPVAGPAELTGVIPTGDEPALLPSAFDIEAQEALPLSVEFRALASRDVAEVPARLVNESDAILRDRAIAVTWALNSTQAIAAELGSESFFQRFEERIANGGDVVRHEQNPILLWGGVSFRQSIATPTDLRPYVQVMAGGTRVGPIGRAMVGVAYNVAPELQLFGGAEAAALAYRFGGRWNASPKYGITYGIAFRF